MPQMDARLRILLYGSYAGIAIAVVGGAIVMPEIFFGNPHRGISYWGNYFPATIPYSAGLLISAICFANAALIMPDYPERLAIMRRLILAIALGLTLVVVTPEQANFVFYWAHTLAAVYLFIVAGAGTIWVMLHAGNTAFDWFLFWALVVGCMFSLFSASYVRLMGVLALGQVITINAGALLLIRSTLRWSAQEVKE